MNHIKPFWDDEYKNLDYRKEVFNDEYAIEKWRKKGYDNDINSFSGEMANYSDKQPEWNEIFKDYSIKDWFPSLHEKEIIEHEVHQQMLPVFLNTWSFIKDVNIKLNWNGHTG